MATTHEIPVSIRKYLEDQGIAYEMIPHRRDFNAQSAAADTHTPGKEFAKCVLLWVDNYYAMVVLPADHWVDFKLLRQGLDAMDAGLIREEEMMRLFPDCELGAEPPFGNLYDLPVYVASQIVQDEKITFNAGTHEEAIRMSYADFSRLVHPMIVDFARRN